MNIKCPIILSLFAFFIQSCWTPFEIPFQSEKEQSFCWSAEQDCLITSNVEGANECLEETQTATQYFPPSANQYKLRKPILLFDIGSLSLAQIYDTNDLYWIPQRVDLVLSPSDLNEPLLGIALKTVGATWFVSNKKPRASALGSQFYLLNDFCFELNNGHFNGPLFETRHYHF